MFGAEGKIYSSLTSCVWIRGGGELTVDMLASVYALASSTPDITRKGSLMGEIESNLISTAQ